MSSKKWVIGSVFLLTFIVIIAVIINERYAYFQSSKRPSNTYLHQRIKKYKVQGIDVSHHQGFIKWEDVMHPDLNQSITFTFIRATVGTENDSKFKKNWEGAGNRGFTRGAYHYYWSNVNSTLQANHFINTVSLVKGDMPPVLDIEDISNIQDENSLRKGLKNWIQIVETHYGVKPILYSGEAFYKDVLRSDSYFRKYPRIWIANYNGVEVPRFSWDFWQYTDRMPVSGIETLVDGNVFKGSQKDFNQLLMR
jgi:lysozyme